jgi:hypothetical protein
MSYLPNCARQILSISNYSQLKPGAAYTDKLQKLNRPWTAAPYGGAEKTCRNGQSRKSELPFLWYILNQATLDTGGGSPWQVTGSLFAGAPGKLLRSGKRKEYGPCVY